MNDAVPTNPFSLSNPVQTESFHPNLAGNQQMANLALTTYTTTYTRVPNVVGLTATDAVSAIRSAGLVPVEVSFVDTTCNNIGYVIKQSPQADARIATGSPVTITVAVKVTRFPAPDTAGQADPTPNASVGSAHAGEG